MNSQTVKVNLIPGLCTPAVVRVSQYDVGRPILFKVFDGTMPASFESNTIATVVGTKPSGLGFSEVAAISGNTASLNSTLAMTQEAGMIQAEVRFSIQYGPDIGTANFILAIEPSPHPEGTTDGTQETMANLETRLQGQIDDLSDRIDDIEAGGSGLSQTEKNLILTLFSKATYAEDDAGDAYDALENLWSHASYSVSWSGSNYTKSNPATTVAEGSRYTSTVTADTGYLISNVIVTMGGVTVTGAWSGGQVTIPNVTGDIVITVTAASAISSISAVYTQTGTIYTDDMLDDLRGDLVVTATFSDSTTAVVTDYTLTGTLTAGTSTITVSYGGKTTTFNVTVTAPLYSIPDFAEQSITVSNRTGTIKKEGDVYTVTGKLADVFYIAPNGVVTSSSNKPTATWFSVPIGAHIYNTIKVLTWNNPNNVAIDFQSKYTRGDTGGNVWVAKYSLPANSSGADADGEYEVDLYEERTISAFAVQPQASYASNITVTFKTRLFIDGVRYL